ncbi:hypothetical protein [Sphingosinicella sp.]|uniref:hypothetical protein n=1 Tax=Sphingosinicella sp. TaxID=1917971 RepID=UPI0035AE423A
MSDDPIIGLTKALESARNVRLGKGVTSKTSYIAAIPLLIWGIVVWRWSESLMMNFGLVLAGSIATSFAFWFIKSSRSYAERNPALALLEGAELLEWHRMEVAAKGVTPDSCTPLIEDFGGLPPALKEGEV